LTGSMLPPALWRPLQSKVLLMNCPSDPHNPRNQRPLTNKDKIGG